MTKTKQVDHPTKYGAMGVGTILRKLEAAEGRRRLAQQAVDDLVSVLRSPDGNGECLASWAEVGRALGMTKQGAMSKYNRRGL